MAEPETTFRRRTSLQNQGMEKLDIERARRASEAGAEPLIVPPSSSLRLFAVEQEGEELFKEFVREQVRWEHCEELAARSPVLNWWVDARVYGLCITEFVPANPVILHAVKLRKSVNRAHTLDPKF